MNRIFTEQLPQSLSNSLAKLYYLLGGDHLLLIESKDLICHTAMRQGFDEKFEIDIDNSTNWNDLFERLQSFGLFSRRQIIILNLPENLTALIQKSLCELIKYLHDDILLILQIPKLTKTIENQDWFIEAKYYEPRLVSVNCQTPTIEQLPRWILNRAKSMNLNIEEDAVKLLCYNYENNLLALKQTLQQLSLLYPDNKLTFNRVKKNIEQSSIFTVFQWIDAILEGKTHRVQHIINGLRADEIQPIILLRTLQRELLIILKLTQPQRITNIDSLLLTTDLRQRFDQLKIWQNRRSLYTQAIRRMSFRQLYQYIQQMAEIERLIKQEFITDIWQHLTELSVKISEQSIEPNR
ncbi:DNA polymerase III subunit delta [Seminibacterium arietis]|uniref:DNA polymerase III subunit delta n=1 Tax=Seminibacterium arietis TaxID=1173502 RepID=A0ABW3I739_9PAST